MGVFCSAGMKSGGNARLMSPSVGSPAADVATREYSQFMSVGT